MVCFSGDIIVSLTVKTKTIKGNTTIEKLIATITEE